MGISLGLVENPHAKTAVTFDLVPEGTGAPQHLVMDAICVETRPTGKASVRTEPSSRQQISKKLSNVVIPAKAGIALFFATAACDDQLRCCEALTSFAVVKRFRP
jgi:hypothetical protein